MPIRLLAAVCLLLSGCLSTSFALIESDGALPVDSRLLGEWVNRENGLEKIVVAASSATVYDIHYRCTGDGDICEMLPADLRAHGWMTEIEGRTWMSVRGEECDDEEDTTCSAFIHVLVEVVDSGTVHLAFVTEAAEPFASSSGTLRETLAGHVDEYVSRADVYVRSH